MSTTKRRDGRLPPPSSNGASDHENASDGVPPAVDARRRRRKSRTRSRSSKRIHRRDAVGAIRVIAKHLRSVELRRLSAALARSIGRSRKDAGVDEAAAAAESLLSAIDRCDDAHDAAGGAEAAAWGLAWIARGSRTKGSAGSLLERLVRRAETASGALKVGDATSARFLLVLSRLFHDVESCRGFEALACDAMEREIASLAPSGHAIRRTGGAEMLRTIVTWARFEAAAEATGGSAWSDRTQEAFLAAVEVAVRLLGATGRPAGATTAAPAIDAAPVLEAARRLGQKPLATTARRMARRELPASGLPRDLRNPRERFAILRTGWRRRDARLLVDARQPTMHLELAVGEKSLLEGPWTASVAAAGVSVEPLGPWEDSCFESDGDATFLEWTLPLEQGLRLERQIVLAPEDRVLMLSDAVVPSAEHARVANASDPSIAMTVDYRGSLQAAKGLGFDRAEETREFVGYDTDVRLLAIPLSLPEWAVAASAGRFDATDGRLLLEQRSPVTRLHAAVWLDLDPARVGKRLTWRQLTVADTRQNLPSHRASGYRVQAGDDQWLVYRALDTVRNRSVLGCNLACEFLLGRIGRDGIVERLIEIQ